MNDIALQCDKVSVTFGALRASLRTQNPAAVLAEANKAAEAVRAAVRK